MCRCINEQWWIWLFDQGLRRTNNSILIKLISHFSFVCMWACLYVWVCMHMYMHVCGGRRMMLEVILNHVYFILWVRVCQSNPELAHKASLNCPTFSGDSISTFWGWNFRWVSCLPSISKGSWDQKSSLYACKAKALTLSHLSNHPPWQHFNRNSIWISRKVF